MISLKHILSCMHAGHCAMPGTREPVIGTVSLVTKDRECCDPHTHMLWVTLGVTLVWATLEVSRTPVLENLFWSNLNIYTALEAHKLCSVVKL